MSDKPINIGDIIKIKIDNIGEKGDGIARFEGFVVIVPHSKIDSTYKVEIVKIFATWALGSILEEV